MVNPIKKLETGLRTIRAGIPYTLRYLRIQATVLGFQNLGNPKMSNLHSTLRRNSKEDTPSPYHLLARIVRRLLRVYYLRMLVTTT